MVEVKLVSEMEAGVTEEPIRECLFPFCLSKNHFSLHKGQREPFFMLVAAHWKTESKTFQQS